MGIRGCLWGCTLSLRVMRGNKAGYDTAERVWKNFEEGWKEL